ncbi:MAG: 2-isopropylmalate synthase [Oscillospiraceae bacterium]|jgi:2-isopropylmalate synthase|nr:2-isopropylmalate synthase [Oscillospiraceae bacterium]
MKNYQRYKPGYICPTDSPVNWVNKDRVETAPVWCSVDLRDGNQSLIIPMNLEEKLDFYNFLIKIGFKEIEVGFPAASDTEYEFLRTLIEENMIPDDVTIQVLTQSRPHIIEKTFESIKGAKNVIVHLYNSTSIAQREQVFRKNREEVCKIATDGAELFNDFAKKYPETNFRFEYSPESFTGTEPDFATEVCNAVIDIWNPQIPGKVIINLPATVEMSMPHVYARQVAYVSERLHNRENVILSVHPHNDRGCAVAATELALLAGAERVEGTLFGNGERTGNADIVTLAMNLYTQGVNPQLDFSNMPRIVEIYETITGMNVGVRHPYSGKLVFAAFSGSHQDAIAKGSAYHKEHELTGWSVPYLPLDPQDISRHYETDVIRINSQSGKGGISYILESNFGYHLPEGLRREVSYFIKRISDKQHRELEPTDVIKAFTEEYVNRKDIVVLKSVNWINNNKTSEITIHNNDKVYSVKSDGNGHIDSFANALKLCGLNFTFEDYAEHALNDDSDSYAAAYIKISDENGKSVWGIGVHEDIAEASAFALVSAVNRMTVNKKGV